MDPHKGDGTKKGLKAVANAHGVIAALTIDQRRALRKLFGKATNVAPDAVPAEKLLHFKEAVSRVFAPHASAIFVDFQFALELAAEAGENFSGGLYGHATWQERVAVFAKDGAKALEECLLQEGVKKIENVNRHLKNAQPCLSSAAEAAAASHSRRKGKGRP